MQQNDWRALAAAIVERNEREPPRESDSNNLHECRSAAVRAWKQLHSFHVAEFGDYVVFPKYEILLVYLDLYFSAGPESPTEGVLPMWAREE